MVSVFAIRNFKFLGFALGKGKNGIYIRAHTKSLKKAKAKLKELTSRSQGRNVRVVMLMIGIEDEFSIRFPTERLPELHTVGDVVAVIEELLHAPA